MSLLDRIRKKDLHSKVMSADEAALLFKDGDIVGSSGFTSAGYPKAVPMAMAKRAEGGDKFGITLQMY